MTTLRAALYARYSSDNQRRTSIDDQLRLARERCAREGWQVVAEHHDAEISAATPVEHRPGSRALVAGALAGTYDVLVLEALDRLARNLGDQERVVERLEYRGVRIGQQRRAARRLAGETDCGACPCGICCRAGGIATRRAWPGCDCRCSRNGEPKARMGFPDRRDPCGITLECSGARSASAGTNCYTAGPTRNEDMEMTGNNTLILNTATMIEAVQLWLDSRMQAPVPTVTAVEPDNANYGSNTFKVELSSDSDRPAKPEPAV